MTTFSSAGSKSGHRLSLVVAVDRRREALPVGIGQRRKRRAVRGALDGDGLGHVLGLRRTLEIGADLRQPFALDHRPDVVEDDGFQRGRAQRTQPVDDQAAARRADEMSLLDAGGDQPGDDVRRLDPDVVVPPVAVIGRQAAPAVVEDDDLARPLFAAARDEAPVHGNRAHCATGRAGRRPASASSDLFAIDAGMELEPVGRGIEEILEVGGHAMIPFGRAIRDGACRFQQIAPVAASAKNDCR